MAEGLNKIVEIDIDVNREAQTQIRVVESIPSRNRVATPGYIHDEVLQTLCEGLGAAIAIAENDGTYGKGEAMAKCIEYIQSMYVDPTTTIREIQE